VSVARLALPLLLLSAACSAQARPPGDGGPPQRDGLVFDIPPIPDGSIAGYALSFDGGKDYATAGDAGFPIALGPQTLELWFNCEQVSGTQDFLVLRTDFSSGVQIGLHDGALAAWRVYADRVLVESPVAPPAGSWHHVAYTYDGRNHVLYLDGVMVDAEIVAPDDRTPTSVWLGSIDGSSNMFKGQIDEVRVWTATRTAAEIALDMVHSRTGPQNGLVAYWTFDDAINGGRSLDFSGSGNDLTLGDGVAAMMPTRVPSTAPVAD
jgi:Concanavalin A-like lectin/glucanases superfamily